MSIFNDILFLQDYPSDERQSSEPGHSYAQGYGNHVASAQAFAPLGHLREPQGKAGRCRQPNLAVRGAPVHGRCLRLSDAPGGQRHGHDP